MTKNADLAARREAAIPRGIASATAAFAERAENAFVWDADGRRYIDFAGGIGVLNSGHRHPKVMARVKAQLERFTHTCFQVQPYESYVALAERLNALAPMSGPNKSIFFTTGAEAVENAVKIARVATGRSAVIAFDGAFHGRTLMTLALTGKVSPYKRGFGPLPAEVYHAPFPTREAARALRRPVTAGESLEAIDRILRADVDPDRVAAILIEPVQGEGGFRVAPHALLEGLRALCNQHGMLLIADEIQCGFGRTGKLFAIEHSGVEPDLVTVAKSLAGGFPLSGVVGRAQVMDAVAPGGLGGTYGGFPVACEAALGVLDAIEGEGLLARATEMGRMLFARLEAMSTDRPAIAEVRGLGAMVAIELVDPATGAPGGTFAKVVTRKALEDGLILLTCGHDGNVVRILVPLTAADDVVDQGLGILERALDGAAEEARSGAP